MLPPAPIFAEPSRRSLYRHRSPSARIVALIVTAVAHLLIMAMVVANWHRPRAIAKAERLTVVTLLPAGIDRPAKKPKKGMAFNTAPSRPAPTERPEPIVNLPHLPEKMATVAATEPPHPADGGEGDRLAEISEAYRNALAARIEGARRYPRRALLEGYQGSGAILFRLDRDGRLIAISIEASTGRKALDRAALALIRDAEPFPAIPDELPDELAVTMPIHFLIVGANPKMAVR